MQARVTPRGMEAAPVEAQAYARMKAEREAAWPKRRSRHVKGKSSHNPGLRMTSVSWDSAQVTKRMHQR